MLSACRPGGLDDDEGRGKSGGSGAGTMRRGRGGPGGLFLTRLGRELSSCEGGGTWSSSSLASPFFSAYSSGSTDGLSFVEERTALLGSTAGRGRLGVGMLSDWRPRLAFSTPAGADGLDDAGASCDCCVRVEPVTLLGREDGCCRALVHQAGPNGD